MVQQLTDDIHNENIPDSGEKMPLVSVIIATFNCARYLPYALDSVFQQTYPHFEVLVIDDGSNDDTKTVMQSYLSKVTYLTQKNSGVAAARNNGVRNAKGEYISFLDADDLWEPDKLELQVRYLESHPDVAVAFGDMSSFNENGTFSFSVQKSFPVYEGWIFERLLVNNFVMNITTMVRKSIVLELNGFDEDLRIASDYHLYLRIALRYEFGYIDKVLSHRRCHERNISNSFDKSYAANFLILEKIGQQSPEISRKPIWRDVLMQRHLQYGKGYFRANFMKCARKDFSQVLQIRPLHLNALIYWLATFLPVNLLRLLRSMKSRQSTGGYKIRHEEHASPRDLNP